MAKKKKARKKTVIFKPTKNATKRKSKIRQAGKPSRRKPAKKSVRKNSQKQKPQKKLVSRTNKLVKRKTRHSDNRRKSVSTSSKASGKKSGKSAKQSDKKKKALKTGNGGLTQKIRVQKLKQLDEAGKETRFYSNSLRADIPAKTKLDNKLKLVEKLTEKDIKYYLDKSYPKFPRAYQIILQTKKGKQTFERANKMEFEKAPTIENMRQSIKDKMIDFQDNYFEVLDATGDEDLADSDWVYNPNSISAIFIRFFY